MNILKIRPSQFDNWQAHLNQSRADERRRGLNTILSLILFAIIPCVFVAAGLQLSKASGPQWLGLKFENSYVYLLNSLLIVKGEHPAYIDHPGTTTEVFGAAVLEAFGHGSGAKLIQTVLHDPEKFLTRMHRALLIFTGLAVWIFPWLVAWRDPGPSQRSFAAGSHIVLQYNFQLHYFV